MYNPFFSWHLDIPIVIGLLAAECIYVLLVRRHWRKAGHYNMPSAWAWSIGLAVIFIALESPLDTIAEQRLLSAHMLQVAGQSPPAHFMYLLHHMTDDEGLYHSAWCTFLDKKLT